MIQYYKTLKKKGVYFLDAPVSGGTKGAESASLAIMVGGEKKYLMNVLIFLMQLTIMLFIKKHLKNTI